MGYFDDGPGGLQLCDECTDRAWRIIEQDRREITRLKAELFKAKDELFQYVILHPEEKKPPLKRETASLSEGPDSDKENVPPKKKASVQASSLDR